MKQSLLLHPTKIGLYQFDLGSDCAALYSKILDHVTPHDNAPLSSKERRVWDVLDFPEAHAIRQAITGAVRDYMDGWFEQCLPATVENRALVIHDYGHIDTHCDNREGDVSAVFFLTGQEPADPAHGLGNPTFWIEDERMHLDQQRLPWEGSHGYQIRPAPGRCIVLPSRVPHHQHPFMSPDGNPHMQIVAHFKFENLPDLEQA